MRNYADFLTFSQISELGPAGTSRGKAIGFFIRLCNSILLFISHVRRRRLTQKYNHHYACVASALCKFGASNFLGGVSVGFRELIVVAQTSNVV